MPSSRRWAIQPWSGGIWRRRGVADAARVAQGGIVAAGFEVDAEEAELAAGPIEGDVGAAAEVKADVGVDVEGDEIGVLSDGDVPADGETDALDDVVMG